MPATHNANNAILNYIFRGTSIPTSLLPKYVGLSTTLIGNDGTGAIEPGGSANSGDYWYDTDDTSGSPLLNLINSGWQPVGDVVTSETEPLTGNYWVQSPQAPIAGDDINIYKYISDDGGVSGEWIEQTGMDIFITDTEPTGFLYGYSRQLINRGDSKWFLTETGSCSNNFTLVFTEATETWGTIVEIFIADASVGGNILYHSRLSPNVPVSKGTKLTIHPQTMIITERM